VQTKGPFYHDLNETLYTVMATHIQEDWLLVGGAVSADFLNLRQVRARALYNGWEQD
jgi:hypothetical protein